MKKAFNIAILAGLSAVAALPLPAATKVRPCDKRSDERKKATWLYPLPDRTKLPDMKTIEKMGAYFLLDEMVETDKGCVFTQVAMVGDRTAIERFGSLEIWPGYWGVAIIKGRVQHPDGTVVELPDDNLSCGDTRDYSFLTIGPAADPFRIFVNYPGLVPGSVIQQQISMPCNAWEGDWEAGWYPSVEGEHRFISLLEGSGGTVSLFGGYDTRGYFSQNIRYVLNRPNRWKILPTFYPADAKVSMKEYPGIDRHTKLLQIALSRPAQLYEPYSPPFDTRTPQMAVTYQGPSFKNSGWGDWINIAANAIEKDTSSLSRVLEASPPAQGLDGAGLARHLTRFYRDFPGDPDPKFGRLLHVLKAKGLEVYHVLARSGGQMKIDRSIPSTAWFNVRLVAIETEKGRQYFYPRSRIPAGTLPRWLQGAEAILIKDRKTWEWATLPMSPAEDNVSRIQLKFDRREGAALFGRVELRMTGEQAADWRSFATRMTPTALERTLLGMLDGGARPGVVFSAVKVIGLNDPEVPLVVNAEFETSAAIRKLGAKTKLAPLLWRDGPERAEFPADQRRNDIDFDLPQKYVTEVVLPAAWLNAEAAPDVVQLNGTGLDYKLSAVKGEGGLTLTRELTTQGLIPAADYQKLRDLLQQMETADELMVTLAPETR